MRRSAPWVWMAVVIGVGSAGAAPQVARGQDSSYVLTFKDNKIEPAELQVPAGVEFKLTVKNADQSPEEFDSSDLKIEKVVAGGSEIELTIKPLDPEVSSAVAATLHRKWARLDPRSTGRSVRARRVHFFAKNSRS